jgi:hypothetical protein
MPLTLGLMLPGKPSFDGKGAIPFATYDVEQCREVWSLEEVQPYYLNPAHSALSEAPEWSC